MRWPRLVVALAGTALFVAAPGRALAQPLDVRVEPATVDTVIGTEAPLRVSIANTGTDPTGPLVAQLVVVDPRGGDSADAEDWTQRLNRPLDALAPGETHTFVWDVAPIVAGEYRVLVSVVPIDDGPPAVSPQVRFAVSQPAALVSGATVPVAVATPMILVVAAVCAGWIERRQARRYVRAS